MNGARLRGMGASGPLFNRGGECVKPASLFRIQALHLNIAVTDKLLGEIPAAMDLEGDAALGGVADLLFLPFHDFDTVDPRGDVRRIALDAGAQFVPLAMTPELRPGATRQPATG